ncbi:hypothetical protein FHW21_001180 [Paraburkholderia sp. WP4_3_2]|nr:hypothetical protein [Paraburkholderia sp. WP4_3_2]
MTQAGAISVAPVLFSMGAFWRLRVRLKPRPDGIDRMADGTRAAALPGAGRLFASPVSARRARRCGPAKPSTMAARL